MKRLGSRIHVLRIFSGFLVVQPGGEFVSAVQLLEKKCAEELQVVKVALFGVVQEVAEKD